MAGHSKWANIKHRKAAQDSRRGKIFTKLIRELVVAAKAGGPNPDDNPRLRAAVEKALGANMKRDTVDKAISRGAGAGDSDNYDELTYEGYAPGGVAILIECMTDNRNRTAGEVRHVFNKRGGNLGTDGSVSYLFRRVGIISYSADIDDEAIFDAALEAGANDVTFNEEGTVDLEIDFEQFLAVKDRLVDQGFMPKDSETIMLATQQVQLDQAATEKFLALVDDLEDLDDVQNVYSNATIPPDFWDKRGNN
jgi:YebC/PmpR family DNA-binding regulatory protein